jgi:hypothetical protein
MKRFILRKQAYPYSNGTPIKILDQFIDWAVAYDILLIKT